MTDDAGMKLLAAIEALAVEVRELREERSRDRHVTSALEHRRASDSARKRKQREVERSRDRPVTPVVVDLDPKQRDQKQVTTAKSRDVTGPTRLSYADAYRKRYHVDPVWNAKVNGQIVQLVKRLGPDEAPKVAAFYVFHNHARYTGARHPVGLLLLDCEGLRTQWATGKRTTSTEARQQDQTQANLDGWANLMSEEGRDALVSK